MLETVIGAVGIVVTIISIIVTVISIVQTTKKHSHRKSNRRSPKQRLLFDKHFIVEADRLLSVTPLYILILRIQIYSVKKKCLLRQRKFNFGINRIEFTLGRSDKVLGYDLFPLIYINSCSFAIQMAHMGTIRLSPLVCHMSWMEVSVKDALCYS